MYQLTDSYPPDAAGGADFLTGAAQRRIPDENDQLVNERIVVCDLDLAADTLYEGRVCLSETTIRHLASLIGCYDGPSVRAMLTHTEKIEAQNLELVHAIQAAERALEELAELDRAVGAAGPLLGIAPTPELVVLPETVDQEP